MSESKGGACSVRPATAADVPAIIQHVRRVLAEFGIEFGIGSKTDEELLGLPHSYENTGGAFWIAEDLATKELIGTVGIAPVTEEVFELRKMYLSPEARGRGLGRILFNRALAHVRERGGQRIVLDTVEQMRDAIAFYERNGFVRDDREIRASRCTRGYVLELSKA